MPPSHFAEWSKVWTESIAGKDDFAAVKDYYNAAIKDPSLGLFVYGRYGVGKSSLVRALWPTVPFFNCRDENEVYKLGDEYQKSWCEHYDIESIILDDVGQEIGVEKIHTSEWQDRKEIVGGFIYRWHSEYMKYMLRHEKRPPRRIIITTNLAPQDFWVRYGGHDCSRLKELCYVLKLTGEDKRQFRNSQFPKEAK